MANVKAACLHSFLTSTVVGRTDRSGFLAVRQHVKLLAAGEIGQVVLQQHAAVARSTFGNPCWDTQGCFVWSV